MNDGTPRRAPSLLRAWNLLRRLCRRPGNLPIVRRPSPSSWSNERATLSCLGHATTLINLYGTIFLTDPVWQERVGIRLFGDVLIGPKRYVPPALPIHDLPPLDAILISHAHLDHLDVGTLRQLPKDIPILIPPGLSDIVSRCGFKNIQTLSAGSACEIGGARITAIAVKHVSRRYPWEKVDRRGCGGYLLSKRETSLFFAGDSAYTRFPEGGSFSTIDVALMGIGGYDPFVWNHATPEEVWQMSREIGARYLLPIHWGVFNLSEEPMDDPMKRLHTAAGPEDWRIAASAIGQTFVVPEKDHVPA